MQKKRGTSVGCSEIRGIPVGCVDLRPCELFCGLGWCWRIPCFSFCLKFRKKVQVRLGERERERERESDSRRWSEMTWKALRFARYNQPTIPSPDLTHKKLGVKCYYEGLTLPPSTGLPIIAFHTTLLLLLLLYYIIITSIYDGIFFLYFTNTATLSVYLFHSCPNHS